MSFNCELVTTDTSGRYVCTESLVWAYERKHPVLVLCAQILRPACMPLRMVGMRSIRPGDNALPEVSVFDVPLAPRGAILPARLRLPAIRLSSANVRYA